jgi:hypothetical protein
VTAEPLLAKVLTKPPTKPAMVLSSASSNFLKPYLFFVRVEASLPLAPLLGDDVRFLKPVPSRHRIQLQNAWAASWLVSYSFSSPIWSSKP